MRTRYSARAIVLNNKSQVLLFKFIFGEGQYEKVLWVTPGGGLEKDESFADALMRELYEETGVHIINAGHIIAERELEIHSADMTFISHEKYFLLRDFPTEIIMDQMTNNEKNTLLNYKWWSLDELVHTTEEIAPPELPTLLIRIIENEKIDKPVKLS